MKFSRISTKNIELRLTDRFLVGIQILILLHGLTINLLTALSNYFNTISPLIPDNFYWGLSTTNIFLFGYFLIATFVTWKLIRNYQRIRFILLIIGTLMFEYLIAVGINALQHAL